MQYKQHGQKRKKILLFKFRFIAEFIIANIDVLFKASKYIDKLSCTQFTPSREVQAKRKPRNRCGFWVFEVRSKRQIISWRTEERDVRPSDRTTSIRKAKNPRATRTF